MRMNAFTKAKPSEVARNSLVGRVSAIPAGPPGATSKKNETGTLRI
jgi:hypothetical protein